MYRSSIERYGDEDNNNDCDLVYYNIDIISNRTQDITGIDPPISYREDRQTPIINDASKYYFSIIRATLDGAGSGLPLFIPIIQLGQSDINLTVYSITLSGYVGGGTRYTSQVFIEYEPESIIASLPQPPLLKQDLTSKYYYVFSYSHWVYLVNKAIAKAMASIQTQVQATFGTLKTKAPVIMYDSPSNLFKLYTDMYGFGTDYTQANPTTGTNEDFDIYFNSNMYQLFKNFQVEYYGGEPANQGQTYRIIISNQLGVNTYKDTIGTTDIITTQDFPSTDSIWSPISSIVFTTSMLPTISEQVGVPVSFENGNNRVNQTSAAAFSNIITDIQLPLIRSADYKGLINFTANPYRLTCMSNSKQEVRSVDIQIYWKCKMNNELYPITMPGLSTVSMKLMFRKKSLGV